MGVLVYCWCPSLLLSYSQEETIEIQQQYRQITWEVRRRDSQLYTFHRYVQLDRTPVSYTHLTLPTIYSV